MIKNNEKKSKGKIKKIIKHKKIIFAVLYLVILPIILITSIYTITYFSNRPVVFGKKNRKVNEPNATKDFRIDITASSLQNATKSSKGEISFTATISKIRLDITEVELSFELNNHWESTKVEESSTLKFNNGGILRKESTYTTSSKSINFDSVYPIKPLWFIELDAPDLYVKVSYKKLASDSTSTTYIRYVFDDYYKKGVTSLDGF